MGLNVGDPIPLFCQLADYNPDKFVQAVVEDSFGTALLGSPFNLVPDATGAYSNTDAVMPDQPWVHASYIVYEDEDYTELSPTEGGSSETFFSSLFIGDTLPLYAQLATYDASKFVRAIVTDSNGDEIADSPFDLLPVGILGNYRSLDGLMPARPWLNVKYLVYSDEDYTTLDTANGGSNESFYTDFSPSVVPYIPPISNIVAFVDGDGCSMFSAVEDTIVQGSARTLLIRLASDVGGAPFNIENASEVEFRMRNTDGSVFSTGLTGGVQVVNAGGGQIAVILSGAQTVLLAAAIPSPATIKVTINSKVTVINLPTQIAVEEAEV